MVKTSALSVLSAYGLYACDSLLNKDNLADRLGPLLVELLPAEPPPGAAQAVAATFNFNGKQRSYTFMLFKNPAELDQSYKRLDPELFNEKAAWALFCGAAFGFEGNAEWQLQLAALQTIAGSQSTFFADHNSQTLFSAAKAQFLTQLPKPPRPTCLYRFTVSFDEKNKRFWVRTLGLNRCGGQEIEALNLPFYNDTVENVLHRATEFFLLYEPPPERGAFELGYNARLRWMRWQNAVKLFPLDQVGGLKERQQQKNRTESAVLYVKNGYKSGFLGIEALLPKLLGGGAALMPERFFTRQIKTNAAFLQERLYAALHRLKPQEIYFFAKYFSSSRGWRWLQAANWNSEFIVGIDVSSGRKQKIAAEKLQDWRIVFKDAVYTPEDLYRLELAIGPKAAMAIQEFEP